MFFFIQSSHHIVVFCCYPTGIFLVSLLFFAVDRICGCFIYIHQLTNFFTNLWVLLDFLSGYTFAHEN